MVWLIGHRQTKGAATAMPRPTVTAPHLYSTRRLSESNVMPFGAES